MYRRPEGDVELMTVFVSELTPPWYCDGVFNIVSRYTGSASGSLDCRRMRTPGSAPESADPPPLRRNVADTTVGSFVTLATREAASEKREDIGEVGDGGWGMGE
jgi:hypothetical protein